MKSSFLRPAVLIFGFATFAASSFGALITFTHTGTGSGSIAGNPFGDSAFTITAVGDTDNRTSFGNGYSIVHDSASIAINGVGTFSFVTGTRTFVNNSNLAVGFGRDNGGDLYNGPFGLPALATWDMLNSIGPIGGTTSLLQWTLTPIIITSGGQLVFDGESTSGTFTAVVGASNSVPDASSTLLLLGCALVGLGGLRRKLSR